MSGLCGWFRTGQTGIADLRRLAAMSQKITRLDNGPSKSASSPFGGVAVAGPAASTDVYYDGSRIAAVWGSVQYDDRELADIALRRGAACALAQGYGRIQRDVLASLRGCFAVAVVDSA